MIKRTKFNPTNLFPAAFEEGNLITPGSGAPCAIGPLRNQKYPPISAKNRQKSPPPPPGASQQSSDYSPWMRATPDIPPHSSIVKSTSVSDDRNLSRPLDSRVWAKPLPIAPDPLRNLPSLDLINASDYQNSSVFSNRPDRSQDNSANNSHHSQQHDQGTPKGGASKRHNSSSGRIGSDENEDLTTADCGPPAPPRITSLHSPNAQFNLPPVPPNVAVRRSMSPQLGHSFYAHHDHAVSSHVHFNNPNLPYSPSPDHQLVDGYPSREDGSLEDVFVTDSPTGHYENPADFSPSLNGGEASANKERKLSNQESQGQHPMANYVKHRIEVPSDQLTPTPVHKSSLLGNAKQRSSFVGDVSSASKQHKFESSIDALTGPASSSSFVVASQDAAKSTSGLQSIACPIKLK